MFSPFPIPTPPTPIQKWTTTENARYTVFMFNVIMFERSVCAILGSAISLRRGSTVFKSTSLKVFSPKNAKMHKLYSNQFVNIKTYLQVMMNTIETLGIEIITQPITAQIW